MVGPLHAPAVEFKDLPPQDNLYIPCIHRRALYQAACAHGNFCTFGPRPVVGWRLHGSIPKNRRPPNGQPPGGLSGAALQLPGARLELDRGAANAGPPSRQVVPSSGSGSLHLWCTVAAGRIILAGSLLSMGWCTRSSARTLQVLAKHCQELGMVSRCCAACIAPC